MLRRPIPPRKDCSGFSAVRVLLVLALVLVVLARFALVVVGLAGPGEVVATRLAIGQPAEPC
jgi:hypothetical protein